MNAGLLEFSYGLFIGKAFAYQLMRQGEIRTVRMGRAVRVRLEDLTQYIAQSTS